MQCIMNVTEMQIMLPTQRYSQRGKMQVYFVFIAILKMAPFK